MKVHEVVEKEPESPTPKKRRGASFKDVNKDAETPIAKEPEKKETVVVGKKFWTENDESMRLTKQGPSYDILMSQTTNKHSKRTYAKMIEL